MNKPKFELGQVVKYMHNEKRYRKVRCSNCGGQPERLIDGKKFQCIVCANENESGFIERRVIFKRQTQGVIKVVRLTDNTLDGRYISYEIDGLSGIILEKELVAMQEDSFKRNEKVYVVFPTGVIACKFHVDRGTGAFMVIRFGSDVIEIVPESMVFRKQSEASKKFKQIGADRGKAK